MEKSDYKKEFSMRFVQYSLRIIKFCDKARKNSNIKSIADQLIRSGTSIGANVVEAKAASSKKEYVNYYRIALKSAHETQYWLLLIKESDIDLKSQAIILLAESIELGKILSSAIITMKKSQ